MSGLSLAAAVAAMVSNLFVTICEYCYIFQLHGDNDNVDISYIENCVQAQGSQPVVSALFSILDSSSYDSTAVSN